MTRRKEMFEEINQDLLGFLDSSPTSFHAVENMKHMLERAGCQRLMEGRHWELKKGVGYYVTRNDSSLIAFRVPEKNFLGFQIMAGHSDSPALKIKANAELLVEKKYVRLNVEKYGGMLCAPWLDRPLSVAGRVVVRTLDGVESRLVNVDRDLLIIPNLAIHMNRKVNEGYEFNAQRDLLPLFGGEEAADGFMKVVAEAAKVGTEEILDMDLFLYNRMKGTLLGMNREFIAAPRLDDLQCVFASLKGFLEAAPGRSVPVHCVLDNEEVGSSTKQGADSTFLKDVLQRINSAMGRGQEEYLTALASSFMVSADNAHSVHPNQPDAVSGAVFKAICEKAEVPYQVFFNRSDMVGGSTLGNISNSQVALNTVDIGLPQLAMHSCYETAGAKDTLYLAEAARVLYSSSVCGDGDGAYRMVW